ncbi:hypothetical protein EOL96_07680, partial [Candidatus Saccharibacteria bacterium]|nr:hypothetical protein [Candidatus Saccharibacteria bacterium]
MNIYYRELRANLVSLIMWTASFSLLAMFFLTMFSGFSEDVDVARDVLENLPAALRQALDISMTTFFTV